MQSGDDLDFANHLMLIACLIFYKNQTNHKENKKKKKKLTI